MSVHVYFLLSLFLEACLFVFWQRVLAVSLLKNSLNRSSGVYVPFEFSWCPGGLAGMNFIELGHESGSLSVFQDVTGPHRFGHFRIGHLFLPQPLDTLQPWPGDLDLVLLWLVDTPRSLSGDLDLVLEWDCDLDGLCSPEELAFSGEAVGSPICSAVDVPGSSSFSESLL